MATLEEIRKKLQEKDSKNFNSTTSLNEIYPFWNIPEGSTVSVRFLPDGDANNTFFWVERQVIKLPFEGVKGGDSKPVVVEVPCVEMWDGMSCPVLTEVRGWFKDPDLEPIARKYWKKRSYVFQGFVVSNPMDEQEVPKNPIRRFVINKSIYEIIKSALTNAEMEENPTDYTAGRDFKITKTKRGQYADYSTSAWSMRTRSLSTDELNAINNPEWGLKTLSDYLPSKPDSRALQAIKEMFEASVDGKAYDEAKWGSFYKPRGTFGNGAPAATADDVPDEDAPARPTAKVTPPRSPARPVAEATEAKEEPPFDVEPKAPASAPAATVSSDKPDPKAVIEMLRRKRAEQQG